MPHPVRILTVAVLLGACSNAAHEPGRSHLPNLVLGAGLTEVYSGPESKMSARVRQRITDQATWTTVWESFQRAAPAPTIDFSHQELILAGLGERPTGGHIIHIDSLRTGGSSRTVFVTWYQPGPGCVVTMALTHPVHVVATAAAGSPLVFVERSRVYDCG